MSACVENQIKSFSSNKVSLWIARKFYDAKQLSESGFCLSTLSGMLFSILDLVNATLHWTCKSKLREALHHVSNAQVISTCYDLTRVCIETVIWIFFLICVSYVPSIGSCMQLVLTSQIAAIIMHSNVMQLYKSCIKQYGGHFPCSLSVSSHSQFALSFLSVRNILW